MKVHRFVSFIFGIQLTGGRSLSSNELTIIPQMSPKITGSFAERDGQEKEGDKIGR